MSKTKQNLIITAAIAGLLTGVAAKSYGDDSTNSAGSSTSGSSTNKSSCSSKSSCKGKGGCKSVQARP